MVWLRIILFFFIFVSSVNSSELNQQEISYFKIIDLNNDGFVSVEEINQSLDIIFQLIDVNKDQLISLSELEELKEIILDKAHYQVTLEDKGCIGRALTCAAIQIEVRVHQPSHDDHQSLSHRLLDHLRRSIHGIHPALIFY